MERVVGNLNQALHALMAEDESLYLVGEDLLDPYGGAFKVSKGLSTAFPDRVLSTPISEGGLLGVANGIVLSGGKAFAELMFGDFTFLAMDQIVNFAAKTVTMYGEHCDFPLVVRCPVGGHRGYGATHSQTITKHLIGVPNLRLYELSPVHENRRMLKQVLDSGLPAVVFENKILYSHKQYASGEIDDLYRSRVVDESGMGVVLETGEPADVVLVVGGGLLPTCLAAARQLLIEYECVADILVPYQLYPFPVSVLASVVGQDPRVFVVEEGTAGGTWGAEVAHCVARDLGGQVTRPVLGIHSADSIIPSAKHLEATVLVNEDQIVRSILEALDDE